MRARAPARTDRQTPRTVTVMLPRRRITLAAIAAGGALMLLAGAGALASGWQPTATATLRTAPALGGTNPTGSQGSAATGSVNPLAACLRGTTSAYVSDDPAVGSCEEAALAGLAKQATAAQINAAMVDAERTDPRLTALCHLYAHPILKAHFENLEAHAPGSGVRELQETLGTLEHGCIDGVVHGMLEGWAGTHPSLEDLSALIPYCDTGTLEEPVRTNVRLGCADAIGHAIWARWQSPSPCTRFPDVDAVNKCAQGVIMQMWRPVGAPAGGPVASNDQLVDMCAHHWPADVPASGCYLGVAYAFSADIGAAVSHVLETASPGQAPDPSRMAPLLTAVKSGIAWCDKLTGDTTHICQDGLLTAPSLRQLSSAEVADACSLLDPRWVGRCTDRNAAPNPGAPVTGTPAPASR